MKRTFFVSIGFKLTAIVSLLLGASLGGLTIVSTLFYVNDIERTARTSTLERVELLSESIQKDIETTIKTGKLIAATMEGGLVYEGTGAKPTDELLSQNDTILSVSIITNDGISPAVANRAGNLSLLPDDALLLAFGDRIASAFAGETEVINLSPETDSDVLGIAFPLSFTGESSAESVVVLAVSMSSLLESLSARELYQSYLVDAAGNLIAHADPSISRARPNLADEDIVSNSMEGSSALRQMQYDSSDGHTWIGSYKRFFGDRLTVVSAIRKDAALEGAYEQRSKNLLLASAVLCLTIILLFLFSKTLTNPIARLMAGAMRVRDGDFSTTVKSTSHDEIGRLSETFNQMTKGLEDRDKLKNAFGKFVNKEIADRVLTGEIALGGESKTAAILFSDIRAFTSISERLTPHEVVEFLNEYMTSMVSCVNDTHGIVDKFIGDAIMATWGVPYSHGNDTENAINGALYMRERLREFNRDRGSDRKPIIKIGIGINSGEVIAGQIGSLERMEYTCIGDAVNLASRVEALNKPFRTDILITEHSLALVPGVFHVAPMKKITVKGKAEPQQIYAVLGRKDDPSAITSIDELRSRMGLESVDLSAVNTDSEEKKYEIVE